MKCSTFEVTLMRESCILRQMKAVELEENQCLIQGSSFKKCRNCKQGKKVIENPKTFINRDIYNILKMQMIILKTRTQFKRNFNDAMVYTPKYQLNP
jgi:hypothetical protein